MKEYDEYDVAVTVDEYVNKLDKVIDFMKTYINIIEADDDNKEMLKSALKEVKETSKNIKKADNIKKVNKYLKVKKMLKSGDFVYGKKWR